MPLICFIAIMAISAICVTVMKRMEPDIWITYAAWVAICDIAAVILLVYELSM